MHETIISQKPAVVQNNTTAGVAARRASASALEIIESQRVQWESAVYRTSNQALYKILADCLAYADDLPTAKARARSKELDAFLKERGYRVRNSSPLLTKVVRAVFGEIARSRVSTYTTVLRRAKGEKVLPSRLPAWIEEQGGVQEIRLAKSAGYVAMKDRITYARNAFAEQPVLAKVKSSALSELADAEFCGQECVLVAVQEADGSFSVRSLVRGAPVSVALAHVYKSIKAGSDTQAIGSAA